MEYRRIYEQLISSRRERILNSSVYREKHHIIPKCLGGSDDPENLVELTAREHFLAHWLLHRIHPESDSLSLAFAYMGNNRRRYTNQFTMSSRSYAEAREAGAKSASATLLGRKLSESHCKNMSKNMSKKWSDSEFKLARTRKLQEGSLHRRKKVYQYDLEWNLIRDWSNAKEAAEALKVQFPGMKIWHSTITNCSKRELKTYGYNWSYKLRDAR